MQVGDILHASLRNEFKLKKKKTKIIIIKRKVRSTAGKYNVKINL